MRLLRLKKKKGGGDCCSCDFVYKVLDLRDDLRITVKYVKNRPLLNGSVMHLHFYDSFFYAKCYNIVIDLFQNQCLFLYCLFNTTYLTWFIIYLLNL